MVQDTGNVQREIRDLDDQIEIERDRNIATNLEQITNDLRILDAEAEEIQQRISAHKWNQYEKPQFNNNNNYYY